MRASHLVAPAEHDEAMEDEIAAVVLVVVWWLAAVTLVLLFLRGR